MGDSHFDVEWGGREDRHAGITQDTPPNDERTTVNASAASLTSLLPDTDGFINQMQPMSFDDRNRRQLGPADGLRLP